MARACLQQYVNTHSVNRLKDMYMVIDEVKGSFASVLRLPPSDRAEPPTKRLYVLQLLCF